MVKRRTYSQMDFGFVGLKDAHTATVKVTPGRMVPQLIAESAVTFTDA
jgi:hypothetical protein